VDTFNNLNGNRAKKSLTAREMAVILEKEGLSVTIEGDPDAFADHLRDIDHADRYALTFYIGEDTSRLANLGESILICLPGVKSEGNLVTHLVADNPKLAFYILAQEFVPEMTPVGIHLTAVIGPEAQIDPTASIGAFCVLHDCIIGPRTVLHPHVTVYDKTIIGTGVTIEANTVIGATGQVWAWDGKGKKRILPQIGGTIIEDECFIGSNITIVRGSLQNTLIRRGCRIAHGTMIGHDCDIGEDTYIANSVAIGGSSVIGKSCFLGSNSTYRPGTVLGDGIIVGAGASVVKDFREGRVVLAGVPAKIIETVAEGDKLGGIPKLPDTHVGEGEFHK